ncbi:MAG: sialidase family protein [Solirubrobacteraceae bacterium]
MSNAVGNVRRETVLAVAFVALALAGVAFLVSGGSSSPKEDVERLPSAPAAVTGSVTYRDKVLSDGGYNTFAGAWLMPDGAVATAFANVTGAAAPRCRRPGEPPGCDNRRFRGAEHRFAIRTSHDDGRTWTRPLPDELESSAPPHAYSGQPVIALRGREGAKAGTLLRRINGEDLDLYRRPGSVLGTAFLQRLAPGAKAWTGAQVLLDPSRFTYNLSRIKRLRDGTLVALGAFWEVPAGQRLKTPDTEVPSWLLMASEDEGATWHSAISAPADIQQTAPANEWDVAELPDGDLLAVMRTREGPRTVRKQVVLRKTGDEITTTTGERSDGGWQMGTPRVTPPGFAQIAAPQHPELLNIEYGPAAGGILHIADEAIHYTADGGRTWSRVSFPSDWTPHYYPNSVQAPGGNIYVFSHAGGDEDYTMQVDKPVYVDLVRLAVDRDSAP